MKAKTRAATTHDEYLAPLSVDRRRALEKLRQDIKAAAPNAEECISYGIPGFRMNGKLLVSYGAAAKHCAFYPGSTLQGFKKETKDYDTSGKGTLRFPAGEPLPTSLVRKIVKARIAAQAKARRT
jgi:uncharacterized protein YdhG (YjbR/CyaY superfamily)